MPTGMKWRHARVPRRNSVFLQGVRASLSPGTHLFGSPVSSSVASVGFDSGDPSCRRKIDKKT